jgi:hypothetical protein
MHTSILEVKEAGSGILIVRYRDNGLTETHGPMQL